MRLSGSFQHRHGVFMSSSRRVLRLTLASALSVLAGTCGSGALAADIVKVGVLQSLTGTMAISEVIVEGGASDPAIFAQKATKLLQSDKVVTVFGGWTSASRKAMLPVFQRLNGL